MAALNVIKGLSTVILSLLVARAVSPAEFGAVSFSIPLMVLLTLLTDLGLASAIVREKALSKLQASACVSLSSVLGLVCGVSMVLLASTVERLSGIMGLTPILAGFGVVTALQVAATSPRALLERRLAYQTVARIEFLSLAAGLAAFTVAYLMSLGAMALVAFHAVLQAARASGFFGAVSSDIERQFTLRGLSELLNGLGWVVAANLMNYSARNVDRFIIGSALGATALGIYGMAYQFMIVPLMTLAWPASGVLLPALARGGLSVEAQSRLLSSFIMLTALVVFPLMTYIALACQLPLEHLLSNQWHSLSGLIGILAPVGCVQALAAFTGAVLISKGELRLNFSLSALNGFLVPLAIALATSQGLRFTVVVYSVSATAIAAVMILQMIRHARTSWFAFCTACAPGTATALAGAALAGGVVGLNPPHLTRWIVFSALYATGVALCCFMYRRHISDAITNLMVARTSHHAVGADVA